MTTILIKKKDTAGAPAPGDLTNAAGGAEIAVNTATKRIYSKDSSNAIIEMGTFPSSMAVQGALSATGTGSITGNFSVNTNKFTVDATTGNVAIAGTLQVTGGINLNGNVTVGDSSADTLTVNSTITSNLLVTGSTYNLGASGATWNNFYINYIKPVGGAAYVTTPLMDTYPDTNAVKIYHSGTPASDYNFGSAGSTAGSGLIAESNAYQATFSNGPGFIFSTAASGGKLLSLTGSGVGIGKNSAAYSLDILPSGYSDGIYMRLYGSAARAFLVTGDGVVSWGNGTTDYGQLTWDTGRAVVQAKNALNLVTNTGVSAVTALALGTTGNAVFAGNLTINAGTNYYNTGSLESRLWTPGLAIGTGTYSGLYGPSLTYLAEKSGSSWVSSGGGTAGALGIDEGYFYFARSNGVGGPGAALTWTTYLESDASGNFSFNSTGFTKVASGTTAARPTATAGRARWNTTLNQLEVADGANFEKVVVETLVTSASGGTITTDGDYKYHTFTSSGTFTLTTVSGGGKADLRVLVVGGGGGGGRYLGGGGGGGAVLETIVSVIAGTYTVTVGGGGAATTNNQGYSGNGSPSSLSGGTIGERECYVFGGGAGGNGLNGDVWGANGSSNAQIGSGGGGGSPYGVTISNANISLPMGGPAGRYGSGGAFGTTYTGSLGFTGGGGGGGALGPGVAPNIGNGPVGAGGFGGSGITSTIQGSTSAYFGGGGGGGYGTYLANQTIGGGAGGGGYGVGSATSGGFLQAAAGTANTGGGGGGGQAYSSYETGGNGGSGIVIIRYKFQ